MKELRSLVEADGGEVVIEVTQNMDKFNPKYLIGTGKVKEIKEAVAGNNIDTVAFNDELSGIQMRNLSDEIKAKIVDRTHLILDIFALRASTYESKLQVELASLEYQLPRLLGIKGWSRTGGGIGTRGPGEQIIETDRRRLLREIHSIKEKLKDAKRTRDITSSRRRSNKNIVTLVGYTNAGKSTLLNRLKNEDSKEVFVEDMLFATLDPGARKARLKNGMEIILSDTVGFVSKLPTKLIEAFKSTLEEIKYSDLIIHVVDASSRDAELEYNTTKEILREIGIEGKKILTVFNKVDRVNLEDTFLPRIGQGEKVYISAKYDENLDPLLEKIEECLEIDSKQYRMKIPYSDIDVLYRIKENHSIEDLSYEDEYASFLVDLRESEFKDYSKYV